MRAGTMASVGTGLAASVIIHLLLLIAVAIPHQRQTGRGEAVPIELVTPEEAAPAFNNAAPQAQRQADPEPDLSQLQSGPPSQLAGASEQAAQSLAQPSPQRPQGTDPQTQQQQGLVPPQRETASPPPQAEQQSAAEPPAGETTSADNHPLPDSLAEQGMRLATMLALPVPGASPFGTEAEVKADLRASEMAAFKAHLKKCWTLPPGYSESQQVKVVVRVALRPDGRLAADPEAIEVTPAKLGGPLWINAKAALLKCQPYTMLPADKYKEWRVLDINFSPDQMAGG
ncbi:MAG TPA: hypothetical protein VNR11_02390 [Xanthobacteraceae bacterium]|nr:hypothetical protein [Xanthobacteraceae bacterium]